MADDKQKPTEASQKTQSDREHSQAAVTGAQSVADAVKRVADAAVQAAQHAHAHVRHAFHVTAVGDGIITVRGENFGPSGTITIGGLPAQVIAWGGERIEARIPQGVAHAESTEIVINSGSGKVQRAPFKQ